MGVKRAAVKRAAVPEVGPPIMSPRRGTTTVGAGVATPPHNWAKTGESMRPPPLWGKVGVGGAGQAMTSPLSGMGTADSRVVSASRGWPSKSAIAATSFARLPPRPSPIWEEGEEIEGSLENMGQAEYQLPLNPLHHARGSC
jgi:hypothetical protein